MTPEALTGLTKDSTGATLEPGSMIGVLGGGQLGKMFADAARRLGYKVAVWDPDPDAPGLKGAELPLAAPFSETSPVQPYADSLRVATYEWENVPAGICDTLERRIPVRPSGRILSLLQNRLDQKSFLASQGFPLAPFQRALVPEEVARAEQLGFPCLCKTATAGYDGKGQWRLTSVEDVQRLQDQLNRQSQPRGTWILEQWVKFEKEISVLVVRGMDGDCRVYPVAENVHEAGILRLTRVPASVPSQLTKSAMDLARSIVEALDGVGVFCVEMFLLPDGRLYVNEVAPRPHNSGHYTLDACTISQFEQQVRAICGLPLGEVRLLTPAVMVNLIGEDWVRIQSRAGLTEVLRKPGTTLHGYGKRTVRSGRKMGHVTILAEKVEAAWETACAIRAALASP